MIRSHSNQKIIRVPGVDLRLVLLLLVGLVHGLIYVFLVPPWQHYDEFNHFQYRLSIRQDIGSKRKGVKGSGSLHQQRCPTSPAEIPKDPQA